MHCLALASAVAASAAGGASVCLGSQVGGPGCSKYLLPCRRAPALQKGSWPVSQLCAFNRKPVHVPT